MTQQEPRLSAGDYKTVLFEVEGRVATVTLNRPEAMNAFNQAMVDEFRQLWGRVRADDHIHVVVLRAERAGSRRGTQPEAEQSVETGNRRSARHGGGRRVLLAQRLRHHHQHGRRYVLRPACELRLTAALEPIGLARRIPLGEALRWALVGLDERMSARRAREIGLVSELVPQAQLWGRAAELAEIIAAKPPAVVQGTVRAIWETHGLDRETAQGIGWHYTRIGNPLGKAEVSREMVVKPTWTLR